MEDIDNDSTLHDIRTYISYELEELPELEIKWPGKAWLGTLVDSSEGLFQWAFTACLFIRGNDEGWFNPVAQMEILLSTTIGSQHSKLERLDQLYLGILKHVFPSENPERIARFKSVLGEILAAVEPLPISALIALRGITEKRDIVSLLVRPLGSVLSGVFSRDVPVRPLHTSFRDFLTDQERSGPFFVDVQAAQTPLVDGCLQSMSVLLRFNICELQDSYMRNSAIEDMENRLRKHVPVHLSYACSFWTEHLHRVTFNEASASKVQSFLESLTLFWLEVISLSDHMAYAIQGVRNLANWSKVTYTLRAISSSLSCQLNRIPTSKF
jgi:hypothetical protein